MLSRIPRIVRTSLPFACRRRTSGRISQLAQHQQPAYSYHATHPSYSPPTSRVLALASSTTQPSLPSASATSSHSRASRTLSRLAVLGGVGLAAAYYLSSDDPSVTALFSSLPFFVNTAECTTGVTTRKWRNPTAHTCTAQQSCPARQASPLSDIFLSAPLSLSRCQTITAALQTLRR